jgi:uncharacterized membrane protein YidH (DUF202 family)
MPAVDPPQEMAMLSALVAAGDISREQFIEAGNAAAGRGLEPEWVLRHEYHIPRRRILEVLADACGCQWAEYDERLPVPAELLAGLDADALCAGQWFPLIKDGDTVIIAAADPLDSRMHAEVRKYVPATSYAFRVALGEDVRNFIQDFVNSVPEHIIGNERTGLAHWRNTMARWRTMLACYRTDFARARTHLGLLRGGLGLITIGRALLQIRENISLIPLYWLMIAVGLGIVLRGIFTYFMTKHAVMRPPRHQTLVEVTASTLYFLEGYQFAELRPADSPTKMTMLARLNDSIPNFCIFIEPSLDNKVRSSLAHERTSLAGHRTIAACYRTIYARARTGLSFIRTGVAFMTIGLGLIEYFGVSVMTVLDSLVVAAGLLMVVDGAIWYWPARREAGEVEKSTPIL